jgi:RNA 2',3'-cyclic 3'-phosphodiesterase
VRLFVALHISQDIRGAITNLVCELKSLDASWKWTRTENLHVTLRFLGEVSPDKLQTVKETLRGVPAEFPFPLGFASLGFFPNKRRPRVLWVGLDAQPALAKLAHAIEESLAAVGIPREEREFNPHLTLARGKDGIISPKLNEQIARHEKSSFGEMTATSFHLIESKLKSTGAEYTTLESFPGGAKS